MAFAVFELPIAPYLKYSFAIFFVHFFVFFAVPQAEVFVVSMPDFRKGEKELAKTSYQMYMQKTGAACAAPKICLNTEASGLMTDCIKDVCFDSSHFFLMIRFFNFIKKLFQCHIRENIVFYKTYQYLFPVFVK